MMATNFPSSADSFTNPTSGDTLDNPPHDQQHANINDAMEAVQASLLDGAPLHIDDANGRVGIGTASPATTLEVDGVLTANHIHGNLAGAVYLHVKNTSGVTIPAGSPVYATGSVGASGETEVAISDADVASTMPALGVIDTQLVDNAEGHATVLGVAKGLDTSAWSVNDSLYVSTSGGLTNVRPTGASELVQKIGRVIRSHASTGEVLVLGAGRSNDVPNNIVAGGLTIDTDTLHVDATNNRVGVGTISPSQALEVEGRIVANNTGNAFPLSVQSDQSTSGIILSDAGTTSNVVLRSSGDDFQVRTSNANRLTVDSSGNVGINDSTPSYTLDVNGDINATGKLRLNGTAVGDMINYTPALNFCSLGNGSYVARYAKIDNLVYWEFYLIVGSTTTISNGFRPSLPFTASTVSYNHSMYGKVYARDAAVGTVWHGAWYLHENGANARPAFYPDHSSGTLRGLSTLSATFPKTWGNYDTIYMSGSYLT